MAKIFIGSSTEQLPVVEAVQEILSDKGHLVASWKYGIFELSDVTIESLERAASENDIAVFVFAPDDVLTMRGEENKAVRDNVVFELGLFVGALGHKSCYVLIPSNEKQHFPTDLAGVTFAPYDGGVKDEELVHAVGSACTKINHAISRQKDLTEDGLLTKTCQADWLVCERNAIALERTITNGDTSDLFVVLLSVVDCVLSRIHVGQLGALDDAIEIEAMYDLMGSWDLLIKYRCSDNVAAERFYESILRRLETSTPKMIDAPEDSGQFSRREFINVMAQSTDFEQLTLHSGSQTIRYSLLEGGREEYEAHRANRAFVVLNAPGKVGCNERREFLKAAHKGIRGQNIAIIESVCEGESWIIVETFSRCGQSSQINHLNKSLEPVLTALRQQKYTLSCYDMDETGLLESSSKTA